MDRTIDKLFHSCLSVSTCDYDRGHKSNTGWVDTTLKQWKSSRAVTGSRERYSSPMSALPQGRERVSSSHQHPAAGLKAGSVMLKYAVLFSSPQQEETSGLQAPSSSN
ncbi:hypothetical protein DPX16_15685 [Anabarilius grahami]|uniref:Uncharacterized protein n=1 Tax=Anabarilius grahami TaxID=495550 RepID=A0A3N0YT37_ANAGA|nr:hypothetical protein DPX16_15685 [Anabarilius grahami]